MSNDLYAPLPLSEFVRLCPCCRDGWINSNNTETSEDDEQETTIREMAGGDHPLDVAVWNTRAIRFLLRRLDEARFPLRRIIEDDIIVEGPES